MPLRILVAGLLSHDSGKTWLSYALARNIPGSRLFKPVGGFNAWHSLGALRASTRLGILAGGDALRHAEAMGSLDPGTVAMVNPVAYVNAYPDPLPYVEARRLASYMVYTRSPLEGLLAWRVTSCQPGPQWATWFNPRHMQRLPRPLRAEAEKLVAATAAAPGEPSEFTEALAAGRLDEAIESCRERLERGVNALIIESFSDALPPYGLDACLLDFVAVAAPGRVLLYSGDRVCEAVKAMGSGRTERILSLLGKPLLAEELPPAADPEELADLLRGSRLVELLSPG